MAAKIIHLRSGRSPVGHYIRIGTSGHRQAEDLIDEGRFPVDQAIIEACAIWRQTDLISALHRTGCELVLDTNVAELSSLGRYEGAPSQAPWALSARPLSGADFRGDRRRELLGSIAQMAVSNGFSAVLAPTHLLRSASDAWLAIDIEMCIGLREELNRAGGGQVAIDYELSLPYQILRDPEQRVELCGRLKNLPVENLWVRASQFGADASATGIRRYIDALYSLVELGYPIISDGIAGLAGLAVVAFGAAGGIAHGIGDHERFDASDWNKPRKSIGGGLPKRIYIPGLDRHITQNQLDVILAANGGRRLVTCNDHECCKRGLEDMINNSKAHYLFQRHKQISNLASIPQATRAEHLVRNEVLSAERRARQIAKLKVTDLGVIQMLQKESSRLERLPVVLENMLASGLPSTRSLAPRLRSLAISSKQVRS